MNNSTLFDDLDLAIDQLITNPDASHAAQEPAIADLLEIADDLRHVPDPAFKMKLKEQFMQGSAAGNAVHAAEWQRASQEPATAAEILPTLSGCGYGAYPVRPANFAASVALHGALALAISLGLFLMKSSPQVLTPAHPAIIQVSAYVSPEGPSKSRGGGSGGDASKTDASMGARPPFSNRQITPPVVVIANQKPHLTAEPTIVGIPQPEVLKTQTGDPLSALVAPSNGRGIHSGIGSGSRSGDGDGEGPGGGPGSGGGIGGGPFSVGRGVSAPRLIYSPDPPYTDEARKAKYQGTVGLWAVVGVDGKPRDLVVSSSLGMGLDQSALEAVRTWRFEPGMKDGKPVPVWMYIEVNFRLF
ncbi:MAG: energy transducer TonB [Acidobacteriia bacterium]|nr:energy transducer TonB [Terriglobia bacterium]